MELDCQTVEEQDIIERYLAEKLSEEEQEAFEQHYLGCSRCFEELQLHHAATLELKRQPLSLQPEPRASVTFRWYWAAAAVVLLGILSIFYFSSGRELAPQTVEERPPESRGGVSEESSEERILMQLAAIDQPPPYLPTTIRGAAGNQVLESFQAGMQKYVERQYSEAIELLENAAKADPGHLPSLYYLGISYLMVEDAQSAIEWLLKIIEQQPNPYVEESHWYLSKSYLKKGDVTFARQELEAVAALEGPYAGRAREALELLEEIVSSEEPVGR